MCQRNKHNTVASLLLFLKTGTALLACKLFKELAVKADVLRERKLQEDLLENAGYVS